MEKETTVIEKIFANKILLILLILALCGPYMFTRGVKSIKLLYEFITTVTSWGMVFLYARYGKLTLPAKWTFLFVGWTFVTTFFLSNNTTSFYQLFLQITAIILLIELAFQYKAYTLLEATVVFRAYIYINLVMILLSPQGMLGNESWWLLGYRNIHSWTLLPIATLLIMRAFWKFGKLDKLTVLDLILILLTLVVVKSATTLIGIFVYLFVAVIAWLCYKKNTEMPKVINLFDGLIVTLVFFVGIILCHVEQIFEPFIVKILHKDITFTGRRWIWDQTVAYLKEHFWFGKGYLTISDFRKIFPGGEFDYAHPHNYVLSLMMQGGVILLIIAVLGIIIAGLRLWRNRNCLLANLFLALMLSMIAMGLTESLSVYLCPLMYPMLTMSMHADDMGVIMKKGDNDFKQA